MARDTQSIVKMSRREGYALHPKAHKALAKRTNTPGQAQNGRGSRNKPSQYSLQLREKQKVKRLYGLLERQFSNLMKEASRKQGQAGEVLLQLLEQRADNAVYRAGFAPSRRAARQLVTHGHFMLNGRRIDVPSIRLRPGDELTVREHSKGTEYFKKIDDVSPAPSTTPGWLKVDRKKSTFSVTGVPTREEAEPDINEQLIVEYYSR
ncbi:MAG TPA: 30S ribosomal protein S4 [Candidatus Saccharimonadales bacterium]|nr:30S ribosomal protein S4 [Candidatus Saccharimonadales bacterium]